MFRKNIHSYMPLYLVLGLHEQEGRSALEIAREAIAGGVTFVQLREKNAPLRQVLEQGIQLRELCRNHGIPFVVNDRVDVAILLDADGVHVGQDDLPGLEARKLLGDDKIVGISAGTLEEAEWAMEQGADYLGVGAIYATFTKQDAGAAIGTDLLREVKGRWNIPVVGIGGITRGNAPEVMAAGADGIAVVSAITKQSNPQIAASELRGIVDKNRLLNQQLP
ncbi:thiamine phosphate synthase [Paenibacillus rigui]|uniref:Thiamine-phosphate synthase n=1 Tax=Paenibacillus rigui TaxID=554312 RepID=A0A229UR56_9BACL|nr:thiamine phosphate synthase [Paenibacillus rigui]OXM85904.1 thiamine phosphate synthase [Paenibacillus rigui]